MGYEGWTPPALVENLLQNRVTTLVDVRFNAISRRPGFGRKSLAASVEAAGIRYVHEPRLGNPPDNRDAFGPGGDLEAGRARMRERLEGESREALVWLVDLARTERVGVLCRERAVSACHRYVVLEEARALDPDLDVIAVR
jgi:uncharacterized protein (DUF488 family)